MVAQRKNVVRIAGRDATVGAGGGEIAIGAAMSCAIPPSYDAAIDPAAFGRSIPARARADTAPSAPDRPGDLVRGPRCSRTGRRATSRCD
jgi:hypothetical protein